MQLTYNVQNEYTRNFATLLSNAEKEEYTKKSYLYQLRIESELLEFCGKYKATDVAEIIIEQIRDIMYESAVEPKFLPSARFVAYKNGESILLQLKKAHNVRRKLSSFRAQYIAGNKKHDEQSSNDMFTLYMRGYAKYWNSIIDENDCEEEIEENELSAWRVL